MKKINRKGFTLIELLAVIVIMAIIVVVTVPTIINTIADARVNSLWNLAVATANSYDTIAAQDMLASEKVLEGSNVNKSWQCIGIVEWTDDNGTSDTSDDVTKTLADILDLSSNDVNLTGAPIVSIPGFSSGINTALNNLSSTGICSAIRLKENGSAEVLLIANSSSGKSKFAISGKVVYALSSADKGGANDVTP